MTKTFLHVTNLMPGRDGISSYLEYFKSAIGAQIEHRNFPKDYVKRTKFTSYSPVYIILLAHTLIRTPASTLIVGHNFPAILWLTFFKKIFFWRKLRLLLIEHRSSNNRRRIRIFRWIDRFIYRAADLTICASGSAHSQLLAWLHTDQANLSEKFQKNIVPIYTGVVQSAQLGLPFDRSWGKTLVFMGRLEHEKGPGTMLEMGQRLLGKIERIIFFGDGSLRAELESKARNIGNLEVVFKGNIPEPWLEVPLESIVVIPSLTEGFCLVAAEAFARGKPVIASNVEALRELVEGRGYLARPADPESFVEQWCRCVENSPLTCLQVSRAYEFTERHLTLNAMRDGYLNALREANLIPPDAEIEHNQDYSSAVEWTISP